MILLLNFTQSNLSRLYLANVAEKKLQINAPLEK